jgi:hypothetical protein
MLLYTEYVKTTYKVGTPGSAGMLETELSQQQHNGQLLRILSRLQERKQPQKRQQLHGRQLKEGRKQQREQQVPYKMNASKSRDACKSRLAGNGMQGARL